MTDDHLEQRVTFLERSMSAMAEKVTSLADSTDSLRATVVDNHKEQKEEIRGLAAAMTHSQRPNWAMLAVLAAFLIPMLGSLFSFPLLINRPTEARVDRLDHLVEDIKAQRQSEFDDRLDAYFQFGANSKQVDLMWDFLMRHDAQICEERRRGAYLEGTQNQLLNQLKELKSQ